MVSSKDKRTELKDISKVYNYAASSMCPEMFDMFERSIESMCVNRHIDFSKVKQQGND